MPSFTVPDPEAIKAAIKSSLEPYMTDLITAGDIYTYRPALDGKSHIVTIENAGLQLTSKTPKQIEVGFRFAVSLWVIRVDTNWSEQQAEQQLSALERRFMQWFHETRGNHAQWLSTRVEGSSDVVEYSEQGGDVYLLEEFGVLVLARPI